MKKIPNLFLRDWNGNKSRVLPELNPEADVAWVLAGEGVPTVKWDGSAVMVRSGVLYVRYDAKLGKVPPAGFEPCQERDPKTGHLPGWIPAAGNPAAKWHSDALVNTPECGDGTYEACGPQLQSNPYGFERNILIKHGVDPLPSLGAMESAAFAHLALTTLLLNFTYAAHGMTAKMPIEGIVWHHPDGRMVKALASDLGVSWKAKTR